MMYLIFHVFYFNRIFKLLDRYNNIYILYKKSLGLLSVSAYVI